MTGFIDEEKIRQTLLATQDASAKQLEKIVKKALNLRGLTLDETAALLQCSDKKVLSKIFAAARKIKKEIYGDRVVIFAPLYLTNVCMNNCLYCGFRKDNKMARRTLNQEDLGTEVRALLSTGQKRLLLVAGEVPNLQYIADSIKTVYSTKLENGEIRRVNLNYAPLTVKEFKKIKSMGIGTYQIFQETYHHETYLEVHPSGPKRNYLFRLEAMDRAMQAGIDDVGIGALFGLYDYAFEVLAILMHCHHLEKKFGVGPHTISVPRIEPAEGAPYTQNPPYAVSDDDFKKIVAVLRLAVPYTGIILSTRESGPLRNELLSLGISQISAASKTNPGGYTEDEQSAKQNELGQFSLSDSRTLREIILDALKLGYLPSFCTACYRTGRTGEHFMEFAKPGEIKKFCHVNGILTFKEYLLDYGSPLENKLGKVVVNREIKKISSQKLKKQTIIRLRLLEEGKRDLYF